MAAAELAVGLAAVGELGQCVEPAAAQPLPLGEQPLVVVPVEQVAAVERDGLPQRLAGAAVGTSVRFRVEQLLEPARPASRRLGRQRRVRGVISR